MDFPKVLHSFSTLYRVERYHAEWLLGILAISAPIPGSTRNRNSTRVGAIAQTSPNISIPSATKLIMCRRFEPSFYKQPPYKAIPHFSYFFRTHCFWQDFPDNIAPVKYRINTKIKLMWQSYFFIFRRLKNNIICFFYKQHFYKQHLAETWCEIITIWSIKRSQKKNKHSEF